MSEPDDLEQRMEHLHGQYSSTPTRKQTWLKKILLGSVIAAAALGGWYAIKKQPSYPDKSKVHASQDEISQDERDLAVYVIGGTTTKKSSGLERTGGGWVITDAPWKKVKEILGEKIATRVYEKRVPVRTAAGKGQDKNILLKKYYEAISLNQAIGIAEAGEEYGLAEHIRSRRAIDEIDVLFYIQMVLPEKKK